MTSNNHEFMSLEKAEKIVRDEEFLSNLGSGKSMVEIESDEEDLEREEEE